MRHASLILSTLNAIRGFRPLTWLLSTPATSSGPVTMAIRSSLLCALVQDARPMILAGVGTGFAAAVAASRLHVLWPALWVAADVVLMAIKACIIRRFAALGATPDIQPARWAALYAPFAMGTCLSLGVGAALCICSGDAIAASFAVAVTTGMLGAVASRNAALPRLALTMISLGVAPISVGALLTPGEYWVLFPLCLVYVGALSSIVRRHYGSLVALMLAEQRHAEIAARFDAALSHMPHGLCTIDETGTVIIANNRTAELFGATLEMLKVNVPLPEFIGHVGLPMFGETLRARLVERCKEWLAQAPAPLNVELADGRALELNRNPVPDGSAVVIIEDVTARRKAEAEFMRLAHHDWLTGLPNRRYLQANASAFERHEAGYAVMFIDLDGFKAVNDELGHDAGDALLRTVAERVRHAVRRDTMIVRLGGDEFALVVDMTDHEACMAFARRIIHTLSAPYSMGGDQSASIGASVGIAIARPGEKLPSVLKRADAALYAVKSKGKGDCEVYVEPVQAAEESVAGAGVNDAPLMYNEAAFHGAASHA